MVALSRFRPFMFKFAYLQFFFNEKKGREKNKTESENKTDG